MVRPATSAHSPHAAVIGLGVAPRSLVRLMALGALVVSFLGVVGQLMRFRLGVVHSFGFVGQFDPDGEGNFSTWYSSTLLLVTALLFETVARRTIERGLAHARHWRLLAVLLVLMSVDETAQIHEMLIAPLRAAWGASGLLYFTWVLPGSAAALIVLLISLRFLRHLPRTRCCHSAKWCFSLTGRISALATSATAKSAAMTYMVEL